MLCTEYYNYRNMLQLFMWQLVEIMKPWSKVEVKQSNNIKNLQIMKPYRWKFVWISKQNTPQLSEYAIPGSSTDFLHNSTSTLDPRLSRSNPVTPSTSSLLATDEINPSLNVNFWPGLPTCFNFLLFPSDLVLKILKSVKVISCLQNNRFCCN